jgi:glucose uptake protein GlcU
MNTAIILAQFWGWLTLIVSVIFFARPDVLREVKILMIENRAFSLSYGLLSLILGLGSVILYNRWPLSWQAVVSLFGWLALLKGVLVLAWPEISKKPTIETRLLSTRIALVVVSLLGLFMIVASWR